MTVFAAPGTAPIAPNRRCNPAPAIAPVAAARPMAHAAGCRAASVRIPRGRVRAPRFSRAGPGER